VATESELASKQQTLEGHKGRLARLLDTLVKIKEDELKLSQEITRLANKKKEFANRQNELIMKEKTLESLMEPQVVLPWFTENQCCGSQTCVRIRFGGSLQIQVLVGSSY